MKETLRQLTGDGLVPAVRGDGPLFEGARPLFFADRPIVLSWSPKSACTHVLIWFLAQEGLVRAAEYFDPWPHDFRGKVYYRSIGYRRAAGDFLQRQGRGYTLVRITRSPVKRLVSIYRHVAGHGLLQPQLDSLLGRDTARTGFSLREMGQALEGQNLVTPSPLNMHLCAQYHPVWDMGCDRVITLNIDETAMEEGLRAIERELDLPDRRAADYPYFNAVRQRHYARDVAYDGAGPVEDARLGGQTADGFPKSALEAAPLTAELAHRLYAVDAGQVATGDSAGRLFR